MCPMMPVPVQHFSRTEFNRDIINPSPTAPPIRGLTPQVGITGFHSHLEWDVRSYRLGPSTGQVS